MSTADWISCSIAFLALIMGLPSFIHTIKSRLKLSVELKEMRRLKNVDNEKRFYMALIFTNPQPTPLTILSVEILADKSFVPLKEETALDKNVILSADNATRELSFCLQLKNAPKIKRGKIILNVKTNSKIFKKRINAVPFLNQIFYDND